MNDTDFDRLAASKEFADFSAILTKLTGVQMSLHSPEGKIMQLRYGRMNNVVCNALRSSTKGLALCSACDMTHHKMSVERGAPLLYRCHAGFLDMTIPLFVEGRHVASISSGQLLTEPPDAKSLARLAKRFPWLDLNSGKVRKAWASVPSMPLAKAKLVMKLLETFSVQLCEKLRKIEALESMLERDELRKAKEFLAGNFSNPDIALPEVAKYAGFSAAHFSHFFKKSQGEPFAHYVRRIRIENACRLLEGTEKSVSEICFACGFNSLSDFIRVFHLLMKTSPKRFRDSRLHGNDGR